MIYCDIFSVVHSIIKENLISICSIKYPRAHACVCVSEREREWANMLAEVHIEI
jgi:hypothetical protein